MTEHEEENMVSMSLGDHLEELRTRLILAITGLFIGLVVCMFFGSYLIDLLLIPYNKAISEINKSKNTIQLKSSDRYVINLVPYETAKKYLEKKDKGKTLEDIDMFMVSIGSAGDNAEVGEVDFKVRSFKTGDKLPTEDEMKSSGGKSFFAYLKPVGTANDKRLTTIKPAEGFMVYIKTSLIFGLLLSSPWVIWQLWAFVASGLYQKEKKFAYSVAPASAILFISGSIFFMTTIAPITMKFFMKFDEFLGFTSQFRPLDYINMILMLTLVFGVAFQMPIVIVFAERMGLVTIEMLTKNRKFVILAIVIVAAVITPPEPVSQLGLAVPLYCLFELSILACKFTKKHKAETAEI